MSSRRKRNTSFLMSFYSVPSEMEARWLSAVASVLLPTISSSLDPVESRAERHSGRVGARTGHRAQTHLHIRLRHDVRLVHGLAASVA